jgi:tRNA A-37 threonylcarbamoyl transferase component Bud32
MLLSEKHSWPGACMAMLSPVELLDWLGQNQFLSPTQADELRPLLPTFADNLALAKDLIRRDWLTPYQVNQIMQGKQDQLVWGDYRLRERIGEGAMGQIFKAWSLRLQRVVALKTLNKDLIKNDKAMERFRREVEAASQLDHPNICVTRDAGDLDGRLFMVMDFIEGLDLSRRVKLSGALPIHEAVEYARQAALGLQSAFERGIVHRDIKPANLMVTAGPVPLVKILDFGLARFETEGESVERLTQVGRLLGTIDYIAPEQATDARSADIRADIYSLGCSLYFLLTAEAPFPGKDMVEKLGPRVTGDPPWVRTRCPNAPPGLEEVIRKMMARRPEDRYQTPIEAAQALQPFTVAMAQPVAGQTSVGVALAMPVSAPAGSVPMAMPIAADVPEPARAEDPAFLGMTATGRDMSSGATAATPRGPKPTKPIPSKLVVILTVACLVTTLLCLASCLYYYPRNNKPQGEIIITKAKYSMPDQQLRPGQSKFVLVFIERVKFKGPVTITLLDLPDGVTSKPKTIPENANEIDVGITVRFVMDPIVTNIRVHAECEAEGISTDKTIPLVIVKEPWKKK